MCIRDRDTGQCGAVDAEQGRELLLRHVGAETRPAAILLGHFLKHPAYMAHRADKRGVAEVLRMDDQVYAKRVDEVEQQIRMGGGERAIRQQPGVENRGFHPFRAGHHSVCLLYTSRTTRAR